MARFSNALEQILAHTRENVAKRKQHTSVAQLQRRITKRRISQKLDSCLRGGDIKLIAEIKRASPSVGTLSPNLDVATMARSYQRGGASAISVLTERDFFQGSLDDLILVRQTTSLPVLCKDFVLDAYQVYEACAYGADAILLIASLLSQDSLDSLVMLTNQLDISALVEVHDEQDLEKALATKANIIGINNRNLANFSVNLETTDKLRPLIPNSKIVVSESGIHTAEDVSHLKAIGVNAVLIGEALVTSPDPTAKIKELLRYGKG